MAGQRPCPCRPNAVSSAEEKVTPYQTVDNPIQLLPKNAMGLARIRRQAQKSSVAVISTDRTGLAESRHHTEIIVQLQSPLLLLQSLRDIWKRASFRDLQSTTMTMLSVTTHSRRHIAISLQCIQQFLRYFKNNQKC